MVAKPPISQGIGRHPKVTVRIRRTVVASFIDSTASRRDEYADSEQRAPPNS
jgi:hypothetical protein